MSSDDLKSPMARVRVCMSGGFDSAGPSRPCSAETEVHRHGFELQRALQLAVQVGRVGLWLRASCPPCCEAGHVWIPGRSRSRVWEAYCVRACERVGLPACIVTVSVRQFLLGVAVAPSGWAPRQRQAWPLTLTLHVRVRGCEQVLVQVIPNLDVRGGIIAAAAASPCV